LLAGKIADASLEGLAMRKIHGDVEDTQGEPLNMSSIDLDKYEAGLDDDFDEDEDENYLGEATLAKLRAGDIDFDEETPASPDDAAVEPKRKAKE